MRVNPKDLLYTVEVIEKSKEAVGEGDVDQKEEVGRHVDEVRAEVGEGVRTLFPAQKPGVDVKADVPTGSGGNASIGSSPEVVLSAPIVGAGEGKGERIGKVPLWLKVPFGLVTVPIGLAGVAVNIPRWVGRNTASRFYRTIEESSVHGVRSGVRVLFGNMDNFNRFREYEDYEHERLMHGERPEPRVAYTYTDWVQSDRTEASQSAHVYMEALKEQRRNPLVKVVRWLSTPLRKGYERLKFF